MIGLTRRTFDFRYYDFKKAGSGVGMAALHPPVVVVTDPDIVTSVMIKDFSSFTDRGFHVDTAVNPLDGNLFLLPGDRWRALRNKLSPAFTSGKLKNMFPLMTDCGDHFLGSLDARVRDSHGEIEILDVMGCLTTDVIGSLLHYIGKILLFHA